MKYSTIQFIVVHYFCWENVQFFLYQLRYGWYLFYMDKSNLQYQFILSRKFQKPLQKTLDWILRVTHSGQANRKKCYKGQITTRHRHKYLPAYPTKRFFEKKNGFRKEHISLQGKLIFWTLPTSINKMAQIPQNTQTMQQTWKRKRFSNRYN